MSGTATAMFSALRLASVTNRTVPRIAMPSAEPTWRIVEFAPDARPDRSTGMSERTMLVSCAVARPTPTP